MKYLSQVVDTFPSVRIPSESGGLAVEVSLIAQLGHGAGDQLYGGVAARQSKHAAFIDALEEPSAKLGGTDFSKGDASSLYSFVVGPKGHPFHRHAGHRVFTAVSGSGGAQLRFSSASSQQIERDPANFIRALRYVNIPPDCLFTVRFGGETWHQFAPRVAHSLHPVFFALSCHTNELGGKLTDAEQAMVRANAASIPALTELLPQAVAQLLQGPAFKADAIPTTTLALDAPAGSLQCVLCKVVRCGLGLLRGLWASLPGARGYRSFSGAGRAVFALSAPPAGSMLLQQLADVAVHHEDTVCLRLTGSDFRYASASGLLDSVLQGFLQHAPKSVTRMMALRNVLVRPLGLRTSPLGCPVSSLLSPDKSNLFAGRYPVLDQRVDAGDTRAQVVLGANDKHLNFRSCVGVQIVDEHHIDITLGTRVHCKNAFGRFYMGSIDVVHRHYVAPTMLRLAVEHAVALDVAYQPASDRLDESGVLAAV